MNQVTRVTFRADASLDIGTGHVMRCLTLAAALRERGATCHFICREHDGNLLDHIRRLGFPASALPLAGAEPAPATENTTQRLNHDAWLGSDWQTDARETAAILAELEPDWLVVDHYALDVRWEAALKPHYRKLMVIDDLADRPHVCDVLLDQNLGREATDYASRVPPQCALLIGPQYALLRPEFAALREYSLRRREVPELKRILITMGGVDRPNATGMVLEALRACALPQDCRITVVMGGHAPWLEDVRTLAATLPWPTEVRVDISDMAQVMADSDLAIGAAGSTSWERCCLGVPGLLLILAENQQLIAQSLDEIGAVMNLGDGTDFAKKMAEAIKFLATDQTALGAMIGVATAVTDGTGCQRMVHVMLGGGRTGENYNSLQLPRPSS